MDVISHPSFTELHRATRPQPRARRPPQVLLERFPDSSPGTPACASSRIELVHDPAYVDAIEAIDREVWLDPTRTRTRPRGRRRASRRAARFGRSRTAARARASARPSRAARARRWASASSGTSRSRRGTRSGARLGASRSSTSTCTTETAPRRCFRDDPSVLTVSLHQWPFWPGTGGPGSNAEGIVNVPLAAGRGTTSTERPSPRWSSRCACVRAGPRARRGRARRASGRPARRDGGDGGRLPRAGSPLRSARATRRRGAGGRLQPRDASGLVEAVLEGFELEARRRARRRGARAPRASTRRRASSEGS